MLFNVLEARSLPGHRHSTGLEECLDWQYGTSRHRHPENPIDFL